jgi:hypothetical protein
MPVASVSTNVLQIQQVNASPNSDTAAQQSTGNEISTIGISNIVKNIKEASATTEAAPYQ